MKLLTVKQVADMLQVSVGNVYQLCTARLIDYVRVGVGRGTIRITLRAVKKFLRSQWHRAAEPVEKKTASPPRSEAVGMLPAVLKHIRLAVPPEAVKG